MLPLKRNCTALSILFMWFWGLCCGFVLISSAATSAGGLSQEHFFRAGDAWLYDYHTTLVLNEKDANEKDVGFFIGSQVLVESVWSSSHSRLLKISLKSPKLFIRSIKASDQDGFTGHTSELETLANAPYYVVWNQGKIEKVLLRKDEPLSLANLKKGFASLFQFQLLDQEINETDSSGYCRTTYASLSPQKFQKVKDLCLSRDFVYTYNPEYLLGTNVKSIRSTIYELHKENEYILSIQGEEIHEMYTTVKEEVGNKVEVHQILNFVKKQTSPVLSAATVEEVINLVNAEGFFTQESLLTEREIIKSDGAKTFISAVNDFRDTLKTKHLGSLAPAKSFIPLISIARRSNKQELSKVIGSKKNQKILPQLLDILGYVQTMDSYEAVMKKLHFDDENQIDLSERYLWALSLASQPRPEIILDLLKRYRSYVNLSDKVKETILLTIASMAYRLSKCPEENENTKVISTVTEALLNGLDAAKGNERYMYFRALRNLKRNKIIPSLLKVIQTGNSKETVLAWKALRAMDPSDWNADVLKRAFKTFYELDKKQDSSARTLSVDIILQSNPSDTTLKELLYYLLSNDKSFEIKQYIFQHINMMSDEDQLFRSRINNIIKKDVKLNNYNIIAQKGLSTALTRSFMQNPSSNGSLLTIQEINGGIVKRGIVNIMLDKDGKSQEVFSLGIFSGGLSSFLSSDDDGDSDAEETATAGMELSVLGTQIRPFTFFEGQGDLMGHVWSGTASERTTAFQALAMLQDHLEYLRLGSGFIAELDMKGATSFDLAGKIEISLWNRNAESVVEKSAGIAIMGLIKVDTSFVRSQVEFNVAIEPKLNLQTDIDFYSGVNLCMRLSQPETMFRHNIIKIERIPGSKHRLRKVKYKKMLVPGKTYSLNKKNGDMCSSMFK